MLYYFDGQVSPVNAKLQNLYDQVALLVSVARKAATGHKFTSPFEYLEFFVNLSMAPAASRTFEPEGWDSTNYLLCPVLFADEYQDEENAIGWLEKFIADFDPPCERADLIRFLQICLLDSLAFHSASVLEDIPGAIQYNFLAMDCLLELGIESLTNHFLRMIRDIMTPEPGSIEAVIQGAANHLMPIQKSGSVASWTIMREICDKCILVATSNRTPTNQVLSLIQLMKGNLFAHTLEFCAAEVLSFANDRERFYDKFPDFEADAQSQPRSGNTELLAMMSLTIDLTDQAILKTRFSKSEFEGYINSTLLKYTEYAIGKLPFFTKPVYHTVEEIKNVLPSNTLVIYIYTIKIADKLFVTSLLLSKHFNTAVINNLTEASGGNTELGDAVLDIRNKILEEPGRSGLFFSKKTLNTDVAELLENMEKQLFGKPLTERFAMMGITGIDHIAFIPHHELHNLPFHLIGGTAGTLASNFKISYLPNLHLLSLNRARNFMPADISITSIGVDFESSARLQSIPQATREAKIIAGLFNQPALINEAVTHENVYSGFRSSKYVHIASHGSMDTAAPNFHCIYLYSPGDKVEKLYAYQVLGLDLRNIELLTLSACETSLGRYDIADNLRGLAASFFMAGVATLIGTLWEVESNTSEFFFTTLYKNLVAGKDKLTAFHLAQKVTRKAHPQFRDWGAFYYMGDWEGLEAPPNTEFSIAGIQGVRFSQPPN
jgi:hypothetical protein